MGNATAPNSFSNDTKWGFTVSASTFQSLTPGPDANPTANGFLHLAQGSALIDAGVLTTGISYSGSSPDLGAIEFGGTTNPPVTTYTLSAVASPVNGGTVSKNPDRSGYTFDESVVLTATPASGYVFSGWSGDASGTTNPLTITMSGNKAITALFTADNSGGGDTPPAAGSVTIAATATPATGLCSFDGSLRLVGSTSVINLSNTAGRGVNWKVEVPQAGTYSLKWRYAGGGSTAQESARLLINGTEAIAAVAFPKPANSTSFLTTEAVSVSLGKGVNEIRIEAILSLALGDIEWLEISGLSPKAADCSAEIGSGGENQNPATYTLTTSGTGEGVVDVEKDTYDPGETATLTATPGAGWRFTGWSGDASGTTTPLTITMDGNKSVSAVFAPKLEQTISFAPLSQKTIGDTDFDGAAASTSGLAVSLSSSNSDVAIITDGLIHIVGAGTAIITASQGGDDTYLAASPVSQELTVVKKQQTITFGELLQKTAGDPDYDAGAVSSSGLAVTYSSSNENVAVIVNGQIQIVGAGTTSITATQEGNDMYSAAEAISRTLLVVKKAQVITFGAIDEKKVGDYDVDPAATASSGLPVSYSSSNGAVATIAGGKIQIKGAGTTVITAVQDGNTIYDAAAPVSQTLRVIQLPHTPFGGEAVIITGSDVSSQPKSNLLEAEDYDDGGQGVAYYDLTMPNNGRQYRTKERVDVEVCSEGGFAVTDNETGEWLKYTVRVVEAGTYNIGVRVASQSAKGRLRIEVDGKDVTGLVNVPATGGMNTWTTIMLNNIQLKEGLRVIKVLIEGSNFKINYFTFTTADANRILTTSVQRPGKTVDVEESALASVTLYPNPVTDLLHIRANKLKAGATVQVYTAGGALVRSERLLNTIQTLSLKGLAAGSYYVQVRIGDQLTTQNIIKN